jgi:DNA polymerase-3 subunit epsilon
MRQIVLDTETTGLEPSEGHRIIEIGCVELINRRLTGRHFHHYINPQREIDEAALQVHGITQEMLQDKPCFAELADELVDFIKGAELIIHNAAFDVGFLNHEFSLMAGNYQPVTAICAVMDSLALARAKHPASKNNLDALCRRYQVDCSERQLHGALLDAELLAQVYLVMTGGQVDLVLSDEPVDQQTGSTIRPLAKGRQPLPVIKADETELAAHHQYLATIAKMTDINPLCGTRSI